MGSPKPIPSGRSRGHSVPIRGGNDALGRIVADRIRKAISQQIVVENRGGAGETIALPALAEFGKWVIEIVVESVGTFRLGSHHFARCPALLSIEQPERCV
jgi:hypothetical protein